MSQNFGSTKPLPSVFGSLGAPSTSAPQSQPAPTGSIFANLAASQPAQQSSMFAGLGAKPAASTSLFGSLGSTQPQATTASGGGGNVFGTPQPQQTTASGGSIFGSSQPQPTNNSGGSMFGALQAQPAATSGGGMFGASQAQPVTTGGGSVFGTLQSQPTLASGGEGGGFGSFQQQNQGQPQGQPQGQLQGQLQGQAGQQNAEISKASQPVYFNNLLEKGRKKAQGGDGESGLGDLPSLQLGLGDIARRARELGGVGTQNYGSAAVDSKAHYLLAASGVNPGTTRRDLSLLNAQTFPQTNQQLATGWDPDTGKYVAQLQQQSTLKMIAEGVERAHRNFDAFLEENVDINWELQRKKIYEHFGLMSKGTDRLDEPSFIVDDEKGSFGKSTRRERKANVGKDKHGTLQRSIFGKSSLQKSVIGTPGVGLPNSTLFAEVTEKSDSHIRSPDDRFVQEKQAKFARIVQNLNQARLQESAYPTLQEFMGVESQPGAESPGRLVDAYEALIEITTVSDSLNGAKVPKERQFADMYLDETPNSAKSIEIRKRIINGSRRCLEKQFFNTLESLVARNPREANLGGIPTTINKVRAYVRIRVARKDLAPDGTDLQNLDGDYCWALVFFCLRSGLLKEVVEYVENNSTAFRALDRNFVTYLTIYANSPDRRLSRQWQDRINAEFQQRSRIAPESSLDPYRMACYKIIGRCELSKRTIDTISQGIEDWFWLQFNLARELNRAEEAAGDVFGLEQIQETIREIGQRYFSKSQEELGGYGTYFFLQILGGMFEQAVSFLYPYSYVSAVHFAIALDFYGLLRVADFSVSETELLTYTTREMPQIGFGRMLGYYTRDFRLGNVEGAVDYLALICLNADLPGALGKSQASLCHEALRELVLETREFAQLLGDVRPDGTRLKGTIEQRLKIIGLVNQEDFLQTVTIQAARVADDNGRINDAVLLYHLAEDYDNVIIIINRALSEAVAVEVGQEEMRLQPLKPRTSAAAGQHQQQYSPTAGSSLSLTAVGDPIMLAKNMIALYNSDAFYYRKILPVNREASGILLRLSGVKSKVLAGQWAEALDSIDELDLLPLHTHSSIPAIRSHAQAFNALPPTVSRNIGPLLLWTITCIGHQREIFASGQYGGDGTRKDLCDQLLVAAKDLMVFAGLVKYRLGDRVWEAVTRCGGDVGAYY